MALNYAMNYKVYRSGSCTPLPIEGLGVSVSKAAPESQLQNTRLPQCSIGVCTLEVNLVKAAVIPLETINSAAGLEAIFAQS